MTYGSSPGKPQANIAECIEKYPKEYLPSLYQVPQATTVPADVKIKGDTVRQKLFDFYGFAIRLARDDDDVEQVRSLSMKSIMNQFKFHEINLQIKNDTNKNLI